MDVVQCVNTLIEMGFRFSLAEDGTARVKCPDVRSPRAEEMLRYLGLHKAELRAEVRRRQPEQTALVMDEPIRLVGVPWERAQEVGEMIRVGAAELAGKVVYHTKDDTYDISYHVLATNGKRVSADGESNEHTA